MPIETIRKGDLESIGNPLHLFRQASNVDIYAKAHWYNTCFLCMYPNGGC